LAERTSPRARVARGLLAAAIGCALAGGVVAQAVPAPTKACETARKKIDREQKSIAALAEAIARDRKAREACTARVTCSRLDSSIESAQRRQARHDTRLLRFREEVATACGG
jgi:hypothetical protein